MEEHHNHFRMHEIIPELASGAQPKHSNLSEWIYRSWAFLTHSFTKSHEPLVCTTKEEVQIWLDRLPYA
jgi:hypothetical protein